MNLISRPREHLIAFSKKYSGIWKIADIARAKGEEAREKWPAHCFMPGSRWTMTLSSPWLKSGFDAIQAWVQNV